MEYFLTILNFWVPYPFYARIAIFIAFILILIFWQFVIPHVHVSNQLEGIEKETSAQSMAIQEEREVNVQSYVFSSLIDDLRLKNQVREMLDSENGLPIYELPSGVFGWVEARKLHTPNPWFPKSTSMTFTLFPNPLKLTKKPSYGHNIEIHKAITGNEYIVGYVPDSSRMLLDYPKRDNPLKITLMMQSKDEYKIAAAIPMDRVLDFDSREFASGEAVVDVRVS